LLQNTRNIKYKTLQTQYTHTHTKHGFGMWLYITYKK